VVIYQLLSVDDRITSQGTLNSVPPECLMHSGAADTEQNVELGKHLCTKQTALYHHGWKKYSHAHYITVL